MSTGNGKRPPAGLASRQRLFVDEYLVDLNATQAAVRAGYSPRTAQEQGSRLLSNVMVAAELKKRQAERSSRTEITQDYVIARLKENLERALQVRPVLNRRGKPTGKYAYDGAVVNGAAKLLGQHLGMFTENFEHSGGVTLVDLINSAGRSTAATEALP